MAASQHPVNVGETSSMAETGAVEQTQPPFDNVPPRVGVKLTEDTQKRAKREPSVMIDILEKAVPGASRNVRIEQLITSVKGETIDELMKRAANLDPDYQPVDFGAWYQAAFRVGQIRSDWSLNLI
jgi:hypothetical protein